MINEYGAVDGMKVDWGNWSTRRKPIPMAYCSTQILYDLTYTEPRTSAVWSRRLTAWAIALPGKLQMLYRLFTTAELLAYFPYFEKNKRRLMRSPCCVCVPRIVARQRLGKHVPMATNTHATIEELSDEVFFWESYRVKYSICSERKVGD
jgi:hypothetical protein